MVVGTNPQLEDGFTTIANELSEAFFRLQLSGNQWRILWVIIRKTYGWKKKTAQISITYFEQKTGLGRRHIVRALNDLVERRIITKNDTTFVTTYGFQKDYSKWELLPKKTPVTKLVTEPLPKLVPIKEKKQNILYVLHHAGEKILLQNAVSEILELLNKERIKILGHNGIKSITTDKQIIARLKDGGSVHECCRIILTKSKDPFFKENPRYFHPDTLFRKSHWQKYLDEAELMK
ncbi:MAG: replication protein [Deltaproteobacteria bacterium]|nr:replication protein [Deltaproteobacteria bacterium]